MAELVASPTAPHCCEFTLSAEFAHEALLQHGNLRVARKLLTAMKALSLLALLSISAVMFFGVKHVGGGVLMLGFALLLIFSRSLDRLIVARQIRQSPSWNRTIRVELTEEGVRTSSDLESSLVRWEGFTRAVATRDGFLLYQGPRAVNWLPLRAFAAPADRAAIHAFLKSKVKVYEQRT